MKQKKKYNTLKNKMFNLKWNQLKKNKNLNKWKQKQKEFYHKFNLRRNMK